MTHSSKELTFSEFKTQLRSLEDTDKYHQNSNDDNVMKLTNSFSKMSNEVSCFKCNGKGHVAKICPNNFKKNKMWCNYCKSQTHVRESCRYKKRDTIKAAEEDSSFVFKINDRPLSMPTTPMTLRYWRIRLTKPRRYCIVWNEPPQALASMSMHTKLNIYVTTKQATLAH